MTSIKDAERVNSVGTVPTTEVKGDDESQVVTLRSKTIRTLEGALQEANVDQSVWEVKEWTLNKWDAFAKIVEKVGEVEHDRLGATELWQVKVWLRRKQPETTAIQSLIEDLKNNAPLYKKVPPKPRLRAENFAQEIDLFDAHFGMYCSPPAADHGWDMETCEDMLWWALEDLLHNGSRYGKISEIVVPEGNDAMHADGISHMTTKGTIQPEMMPWHDVVRRSIDLRIALIERCLEVAPVRILPIPGNHDVQSSFLVGQVLWAYFHNHPHVTVDRSPSPYKCWEFGPSLIGFEHGRNVKTPKYVGLMANSWKDAWARTEFHEWHVGDQHRKGTTGLVAMEESGVSIEYLAALTPPNEWHKMMAYNFQKRGATSFIYSDKYGPISKLQCHIGKYSGKPLGS